MLDALDALTLDEVRFIAGQLGPMTCRDVALLLDVSPQTILNIELRALAKMRRGLERIGVTAEDLHVRPNTRPARATRAR